MITYPCHIANTFKQRQTALLVRNADISYGSGKFVVPAIGLPDGNRLLPDFDEIIRVESGIIEGSAGCQMRHRWLATTIETLQAISRNRLAFSQ